VSIALFSADIFDFVADARPWSVIEPIIGPATDASTAITIITTMISIRVKPALLEFIIKTSLSLTRCNIVQKKLVSSA
jgi:hypothetical protein